MDSISNVITIAKKKWGVTSLDEQGMKDKRKAALALDTLEP